MQLGDFLDDDGNVDPMKVKATAQKAIQELGSRPGRGTHDPTRGKARKITPCPHRKRRGRHSSAPAAERQQNGNAPGPVSLSIDGGYPGPVPYHRHRTPGRGTRKAQVGAARTHPHALNAALTRTPNTREHTNGSHHQFRQPLVPRLGGRRTARGPAITASVAAQVSTVVPTSANTFRIPIVSADPTAAWVAEGAEITPSDPTLTELVVTPLKLAGLTIISKELADDASPEAAQVIGDGLARDIARKLDAAFFANTTSNGPSGLLSLTTSTAVEAASSFTTLDAFASAIFTAEGVGAQVDSL